MLISSIMSHVNVPKVRHSENIPDVLSLLAQTLQTLQLCDPGSKDEWDCQQLFSCSFDQKVFSVVHVRLGII